MKTSLPAMSNLRLYDLLDLRFIRCCSGLYSSDVVSAREILTPPTIIEKGEIGLITLTASFLDFIAPIPVSSRGARIGNIEFSKLGLGLRGLIDATRLEERTYNEQQRHISHFSKKYGRKGYAPQDIAATYAPIFFQKHELHTQAYFDLLQHLIDTQDNKSIVALFLMVHEFGLPLRYNSNVLSDIFDTAITKIINLIQKRFMIKDLDVFSLDVQALVYRTFNILHHKTFHGFRAPTHSDSRETEDPIQKATEQIDFTRLGIKRNERFIHVHSLIDLRGGENIFRYNTVLFSSEKQIRSDMQYFEKLLNLTGSTIHEDQKVDITTYAASIHTQLQTLMAHFRGVATTYANFHKAAYEEKFNALAQSFEQRIESLTQYPPEKTMDFNEFHRMPLPSDESDDDS